MRVILTCRCRRALREINERTGFTGDDEGRNHGLGACAADAVARRDVLDRLAVDASHGTGRRARLWPALLSPAVPSNATPGSQACFSRPVTALAGRFGRWARCAPGTVSACSPATWCRSDGCVVDGSATLATVVRHGEMRPVRLGEHLAAGERLHDGTLELRAEADAASSHLQRLRSHVQHAMGSRDPAGRLAPDLGTLARRVQVSETDILRSQPT